ncbi:MAG: CDF family Co(II)/Ni(II) efflux transporter DmeF [Planctomycetota bacterium]
MAERPWKHDHTFGQDEKKPGEIRTLIVVLLTAATMVLEIVAGMVYGSMALLADGLHMGSHATALAIAMVAYVYARKFARDERFAFGTGKVNSLAGYTGAVLLAMFALLMAWESVERLVEPVPIAFNQALLVAVVGLIVNGLSVWILGVDIGHAREHHHEEDAAGNHHDHHDRDHNLRSAYLHVLADALTSLLAIFALLAGKYLGWNWLDPVMGIVGAILVARWSVGLLRATGRVLLDRQALDHLRESIRRCVESQGDEVADLHLWAIAPDRYCLVLSVVADHPGSLADYRAALPTDARLAHVTVEVWQRGRGYSATTESSQLQ